MKALRINHVSVHAYDLEESARFYQDLFGMERVPAPNFPGIEVIWLQLGGQQLHLFQRDVEAPAAHHFGIDVEDFATVYRTAKERDLLDLETPQGRPIRMHPAGWVQMYIRDPAGNQVEINWQEVETLPEDIRAEIPNLDDDVVQAGDERVATLYA
jgi:catechol 2,3-dioxygenase-like lactoylglutathione lyase family enzyme